MWTRSTILSLVVLCLLKVQAHPSSDAAMAPGGGSNSSLSTSMGMKQALRSISEATRSGDLHAQHQGLIGLACLQLEQGLHPDALRTAYRSKEIATGLGDVKAMIASLHCISRALRAAQRHEKAVEMARNIMALAQGDKDPEAVHAAHILLIDQLMAAGHTTEAAMTARARSPVESQPLQRASLELRLGMIELTNGNSATAFDHLRSASPVLEAQGSLDERFELAMAMARVHAHSADKEGLARQVNKAEALLPKVNREENRYRIQELRVELAVAQGRMGDAVAILKALRQRLDSVHATRLNAHYAGLQVIDELDRAAVRNQDLSQQNKQHQAMIAGQRSWNRKLTGAAAGMTLLMAALAFLTRRVLAMNRKLHLKSQLIRRQGLELNTKNLELKQQNMRLTEALVNEEEKETLIKEIHHRVKNNLQVVESLLSIEGGGLNDGPDQSRFKQVQGRIRSMALVHDHIYRSNGAGNGSLKLHLEELARNVLAMFNMHDRVSVSVTSDRNSFPEEVQMPLTLLVNELLTNALKHSFNEMGTGHVRIALRSNETNHELVFTDNGPAWAAGGGHGERSFGLQLIDTLSEQLDGTVERSFTAGNVFRLTFGRTEAMRKAS